MKKRVFAWLIGSLFLPLIGWATPVVLQIVEQNTYINGKPTTIFNIVSPNGSSIIGKKNEWLNLLIQNKTSQPTLLHWHGMIVPNDQDGVPLVTQSPVPPGKEYRTQFQLLQSGTFLARSSYKSQLQNLGAVPVIVLDEKRADLQNVVMLLQDFINTEHYAELRNQLRQDLGSIGFTPPQIEQPTMAAYLTNSHTLANPQIVRVNSGSTIYLRVINAAANSNFFIDLGQLKGSLIAVDSEPIKPSLFQSQFQIAQGQRLDILLTIPQQQGEGYYPLLAQAEGTTSLTGMILAVPSVTPPPFHMKSHQPPKFLDYSQELQLSARYPLLPQKVTKTFNIDFTGNMLSYLWTMNNQIWPNVKPLNVKYGDRVNITLNNKTVLAIPVHLHGHVFQVKQINGKSVNGAMRDTVLVLPNSVVTIAFDADNPGSWLLEGAIPYSSYGRTATVINYEDYSVPIFKQKDTGIPPSSASL